MKCLINNRNNTIIWPITRSVLAMATPDDLRREKPEYYAQIQGNYFAT